MPPRPHYHGVGLTAEGDDAHGVEFVFRADVGAHADDEDVAEAGCGRDDPHKDPQDNVSQQVLKGRDAVSVGLAAAHVRGVATVLELLEVAAKHIEKVKLGNLQPREEETHPYRWKV